MTDFGKSMTNEGMQEFKKDHLEQFKIDSFGNIIKLAKKFYCKDKL
jgi:hypothetical protein